MAKQLELSFYFYELSLGPALRLHARALPPLAVTVTIPSRRKAAGMDQP